MNNPPRSQQVRLRGQEQSKNLKHTNMKRKVTRSFLGMDRKRVSVAVMCSLLGGASLFAQNWVDVTGIYLQNADLSAGNVGWTSGTITPNVQTNRVIPLCEVYQANGSVAQKVMGLASGTYKLTVQGFNRPAENDGGAAYDAGTEVTSAKLFAGDDSVLMKSLYSETPDETLPNTTKGWPESWDGSAAFFTTYPESYLNELVFTVPDGTSEMLMGIVTMNVNTARRWTMFTDFKLYYDGESYDVFVMNVQSLSPVRDSLNTLGVTAAAQLTAVLEKYADYDSDTPEEDLIKAYTEVDSMRSLGQSIFPNASSMKDVIARANDLLGKLDDGTYSVVEEVKTGLREAIAAAQAIMDLPDLGEAAEALPAGVTALEETISGVNGVIGLSYSLSASKNLADEVGGLADTPEYQQVLADMQAAELLYDSVAKHVAALDSVISAAITPEFLAKATADNPIDFTAFIENPNIYQTGDPDHIVFQNKQDRPNVVDGWTVLQWAEGNSPNVTADLSGDSELYAGSWSANDANNVSRAHYQAIVGGKNGIKLPMGVYELRAATYADDDPNAATKGDYIHLYATPDSVNFSATFFNKELDVFEAACVEMGTTTTVSGIIVGEDGKLYIGVKGADLTKYPRGNGRYWTADNFRLYYVGSDALNAYRSRLQGRLDECEVLHDSLFNYGIEDEDFVEIIGEASEYLEEGSVEDLISVIDELDIFIADANSVITNYLALGPALESAGILYSQLSAGQVFVQPKAQETFVTTYENASLVASDMSWDNYLSEDIQEQVDTLQGATTVFMNSAAICYPMGTAKILADQIGGLDQTGEYQEIVRLLGEDELFQLDVDMAVQGLQGVCLEAMTPDVLAKATVENPFNMTTFIVNPNIYQDAVDMDGNPIDTEINGWICETNADGAGRTGATSGDTWLWCYSWSSNDSHNISSATNYRQVVGTQANLLEEGKYVLPTGAYRVEAATRGANLLSLYAQTNSVEISTVTSSLEEDSLVYTYTEIESADSAFNGDVDVWDEAQSLLGTTTAVPEIYVDNGAVTIGVRGEGRVGGNGQSWQADNFRLYYVGTKRGSGTGIDGTIADKTAGVEAEIVDVYDLTGVCLRKQVRRADAVKGLKKGIYVVGGKKVIVAGN